MTNLDRLLEKSRGLRFNRNFCETVAEPKDEIITIAVEALKEIENAWPPATASVALFKIEILAAKALGENES